MVRVEARVLKGFRDYLPAEDVPRQALLRKVAAVFESFGFGPLTTPAIEYADILLGKYGTEGDKLLYRFRDNGGRDVALRYDLTVPLARVVAQHRDLEVPFRRYQIAPVWRAEKPARGRFREFYQCDVDIVGEPSMAADAECCMVGLEVLAALGVPGPTMRLNNRKLLDGIMDGAGVAAGPLREAVLRAVDKLPKVGRDAVAAELAPLDGISPEVLDRLFALLARPVRGREDVLALGETLPSGREGAAELARVLDLLEEAGYGDRVEVDLSIARGLDYYTGTIYETFVAGREAFGSVMSGGRYDTLLGMFLKESVPAVGISLGIDRLLSVLLDLGLVTPRAGVADVFLALLSDADAGRNAALARRLRGLGLKVEVSLQAGKLGRQFKYAERKGYRFVLLQGEEEGKTGSVAVKDLATGEQRIVSPDEVPRLVC